MPDPLPPIGDLLAQPYAISAFSQGMTSDDFQSQFGQHGDQVRWWKGFRAPESSELGESDGYIYIEQALASDVRVLIHTTKRDTFVPQSDMGIVPKGSTGYAGISSQIELAKGDRIVAVNRTFLARASIVRGHGPTDDFDKLPQRFVSEIKVYLEKMVLIGNEPTKVMLPVDQSDVEAVADFPDARGNPVGGVRWLQNEPPSGTEYFVEYRFCPLYRYDGDEQGSPQGSDGRPLPQRGILTMERC